MSAWFRWRTAVCAGVLTAGLAAPAGCASHAGGGAASAEHHGRTAASASDRASDRAAGRDAAADLRVGLTEWTIVTSSPKVPPGRVTVEVTNTGATGHDLVVTGRRGRWRSAHLAPGERGRVMVRAAPGEELTLWCSLPGHEAQGMHTTLRVSR